MSAGCSILATVIDYWILVYSTQLDWLPGVCDPAHPGHSTAKNLTVQIDYFFLDGDHSHSVCTKNGHGWHDLCVHYTANYEMLRRYIVITKEFVVTSPIFSFCFVFKRACACCAPVYTSLCLVISHSVFVLMSSVINSPLVGRLIYISTYLHSIWVAACLSPSASGLTASGCTSGYVVFHSLSSSPEVLFQLQTLISCHCSKAAGHIQKSAGTKTKHCGPARWWAPQCPLWPPVRRQLFPSCRLRTSLTV